MIASRLTQSRSKSQSPSEVRLVEVLDAYLAAAQEGRAPARDVLLADHPELAEDLEACLASLEFIRQASLTNPPLVTDAKAVGANEGEAGIGDLGDFRLVAEVGRGGMGVVYEAVQRSLNRRVALKVLPFAAAMDPTQLRRFQTEALAAAQLHHTHIVPVYSVGCERGVHYYSMQFIDGQTLAQAIAERRRLEAPRESLAPTQMARPATPSPSSRSHEFFRTAAALGIQAAEALDHAHKFGIVHRDIKPANLLLDVQGNLWITDFGLARLQDDAGLTITGDLLGTLRYMSPEQALAKRGYLDHRTDIYSLGATLYELVTLRPAVEGQDRQEVLRKIAQDEPTPPRRFNPAIPHELETILLKAMNKEPGSRYATAQELADDLDRFLEHKPIRAKRPTLLERAGKWSRRHRPVVASISFALVLAMAGMAVSTFLIEGQRQQAVTNLRDANHQRDLAAARSRELESVYDSQELQLYISLVNRAQAEWSSNNVALAEQLLDECPENRRGWEWYHCQRLCHLERLTLRHDHPVLSLAFSPDGRWMITAANDVEDLPRRSGEWAIWDTATGLKMESRPSERVRQVRVDPTGTTIAVGSSAPAAGSPNGTVTLWRATGWPPRLARAPFRILRTQCERLEALAFSPDGRRVATASGDLELWEVSTGERLLAIGADPGKKVFAVAFRPDGKQLAVACSDGPVKLYDVATGRPRVLSGHDGEVYGVAYSRDGSRLATCGWDETVRVWDSPFGNRSDLVGRHDSFVRAVTFNPDGGKVASASQDNTVRLWDTANRKVIGILRGHNRFVTNVAFSPDGQRIASASEDGTVKIWDDTAAGPARTLPHANWVPQILFFPDGLTLASACWDNSIRMWDAKTGREIRSIGGEKVNIQGMGPEIIHGLAISPDGQRIASTNRSGTVRLWDTTKGQLLGTLRGHQDRTIGVVFHPGGGQLASTSIDGTLRLWNIATGLRDFDVVESSVIASSPSGVSTVSAAYSPDGRQIAAASTDATIRLFDPDDGHELRRLACLCRSNLVTNLVGMLAYDRTGRWLAACSNSAGGTPGEVRVFDAMTGRQIFAPLQGHMSTVTAVAFSPDGRRIASASLDRTVKLWETDTGREVFTLRGQHASGVLSVTFSPDGRRLATASTDHTVKIWDTVPGVSEIRVTSGPPTFTKRPVSTGKEEENTTQRTKP